MVQPSAFGHRSLFYFPAHAQDIRAPSVVPIGLRQVVQTLVIALVVSDDAALARPLFTPPTVRFVGNATELLGCVSVLVTVLEKM